MRQHAGAGPTQGRDVIAAGCQRHRQGVGLAVCRVERRHLLADPDRLLGRAEAGEIVGQRQEFDRGGGEVGRREECPLDIGFRSTGRLERDGNCLVHPRLGMAGGDRRRDQIGCPIEAALLAEFSRRHAKPCEPHCQIPGIAGIRTARGEVGFYRLPQVARLDNRSGQRNVLCGGVANGRRRLHGSIPSDFFTEHGRLLAPADAGAGIGNLKHATATHAAATRPSGLEAAALAAVDATGTTESTAGLKRVEAAARVHRHHEIGHRVDLHDEVFRGLVLGRDEQHFILDQVGEVQIAQQQPQRRT